MKIVNARKLAVQNVPSINDDLSIQSTALPKFHFVERTWRKNNESRDNRGSCNRLGHVCARGVTSAETVDLSPVVGVQVVALNGLLDTKIMV